MSRRDKLLLDVTYWRIEPSDINLSDFSWIIAKDPDAGKDWGHEEKGATENEMVGWHHQINVHEFEQTLGNGEGQGSLACYSPWGLRVGCNLSTEQQQGMFLKWTIRFICNIYVPRQESLKILKPC